MAWAPLSMRPRAPGRLSTLNEGEESFHFLGQHSGDYVHGALGTKPISMRETVVLLAERTASAKIAARPPLLRSDISLRFVIMGRPLADMNRCHP